jgi:arsenite-transporting ATPase
VAPNLYAQEISVLDEIREHWGQMQDYVGNALRQQGMSKAVAEEMSVIPGMEEVVSLLLISRQAKQGNYDRVIVDAAPTGETIRLLTMPESFQWYVGRMSGWGDTTLKLTSMLLRRVMPDKDPFVGLNNLVKGVRELQEVLVNPDITSYRVVVNPEKMVLKEGARAITYLSLFGYPVDAVVVNRILPGIGEGETDAACVVQPSSDPYLHRLQQIQARYLADIEREFYPLPILRSDWFDVEIVGRERLSELAASVFGDRDPGDIFHVGQVQEIKEDGDDFVLNLPLPQVELDKVKLSKRGDELFVSIGNFKRELLLPSVLAHRDASGAVFAEGILKVRFPPAQVSAA